jgi:CRISPR type III-A-associated protein Csm2
MEIENPKIDPNLVTIKKLTEFGKSNVKEWLRNGINKDSLKFCEEFGFCLSRYCENKKPKPLSTNQIRNVYGEVKRIEMLLGSDPKEKEWKTVESKVLLLKPKMAYSAKRDKSIPAKCLYEIVKASIEVVENSNLEEKITSFQNFAKLFEAIIAYHRAYD